MVRSSGISATKPVFPTYLLHSFNFGFSRRGSSSSGSSAEDSAPSTAVTTPNNSPPEHGPLAKSISARGRRTSRAAPDTLRCLTCSADIAFASQIISKGFTGRHGRAFLVAPPSPPAAQSLLNIRVGRSENRQLVTGWHVVADISCSTCTMKLGWKYVDAKEPSQKYKVGKYILETERVVTFRTWEDVPVDHFGTMDDGLDGADQNWDDSDGIEFDSEDEDECEDMFSGTWNATEVAKRRSQMIARKQSDSD